MSSKEFEEWLIFDRWYPTTEDRVESGFARLLCTLANMVREKKQRPFELKNFFPDYMGLETKERRRPVKELKAKFVAWACAHNEWLACKLMKEKENANTEHRSN